MSDLTGFASLGHEGAVAGAIGRVGIRSGSRSASSVGVVGWGVEAGGVAGVRGRVFAVLVASDAAALGGWSAGFLVVGFGWWRRGVGWDCG